MILITYNLLAVNQRTTDLISNGDFRLSGSGMKFKKKILSRWPAYLLVSLAALMTFFFQNMSNPVIISVITYGADPTGATDSTAAFQRALAFASTASNNVGEVDLPAGKYLLNCPNATTAANVAAGNMACLRVTGMTNVNITGINGVAQLILGNTHAGVFYFSNVSNVTLQNLSIDYVIPPFSQGTITAVTSNSYTVQLDLADGFQDLPSYLCTAFNAGNPNSDSSPNNLYITPAGSWGLAMEPINGKLIRRTALPGTILAPTSCQSLGSGAYTFGLTPLSSSSYTKYVSPGDNYVQLIGRGPKHGIWFDTSANVSIGNVQIRAGGGLATVFTSNTGTINISGLQVAFAPGSNRFLTTDADAIHMQSNWATPTIENCVIEGMSDDGINIYSVADIASGLSQGTTIGGYIGLEVRSVRSINAGDSIEVIAPDTGALRGNATVTLVGPGHAAGFSQLTLSAPISGIQTDPNGATGDYVFNISAGGPGAVIENNTFGRHRGRDIVSHSFNSTISGNYFTDVNWMAIDLTTNATTVIGSTRDIEGPTAHNVTIQNNFIYGGDLTYTAQIQGSGNGSLISKSTPLYGPTNVIVQNNRLVNPPGGAINLGEVTGSSVTGNVISTAKGNPCTSEILLPSSVATESGNLCLYSSDQLLSADSGSLDGVSLTGIASGWAMFGGSPAQSSYVDLYLDGPYGTGTFLTRVWAGNMNPDWPFTGTHQYSLDLAAAGVHGTHVLYAYGISNPANEYRPFLFTPHGVLFSLP